MIEALPPGRTDGARGEPTARPGQQNGAGLGARIDQQTRRRLWLLAACLLLTALAFTTRPGNIIADTKIDMAIDPARFLQRALHLWDPAQFGVLQNQAAGYFFPMGPFFLLGKMALLPAWVTQRLWMTAIDCAALVGVVRLSRRLGIGTDGSQLIGGLAYALSPAALSMLGVLSAEYLPAAMLPWILLPLVRAVQEQAGALGMLRAATLSAVAVALCSGINAAAVAAVLVPPVIYLLTAPRPAKRFKLLTIWLAAVLLACMWWIIPLLLLSKYGFSILPYTESAATTTRVANLASALRGTENWVTYLTVNGKPWWPVGFTISTTVLPTVLTGIVAGLGLTGLLRLRRAERRFLICVLIIGLLLIVSGHVMDLGNPLAGRIDQLINGPLGALRNVRKFDPLIRLPISLGLAGLLPALSMRRLRGHGPRLRAAVGIVAVVSIAGIALPAATTGLAQSGAFPAFPAYWVDAANWLNAHAGNQAVLAEPGARFGQYVWGQPMDDVLEALSTGDWASMQLSSIGSVGNERLLQAIDEQISAGDGSTGLAQVLGRIGVKYIVVRNDLIRSDLLGAWPARVHQALADSPGIRLVARFGKVPIGNDKINDATRSLDPGYPPVQIYQVSGAQPVAEVIGASQTMRVFGGPEALLQLASEGLLRNRPVVLNSDPAGVPVRQTVLTDLLRRRVRHFGEIRADYSQTLTARASVQTFEAADDFMKPAWLPYLATARYSGITNVIASTSAADISAIPAQSATGLLPFAAIDGNLKTMWESGGTTGPVGQWIRIYFNRKLNPHRIRVAFVDSRAVGPPVSLVAIKTATGRKIDKVAATGDYQLLRVPNGLTSWLRIKIDSIKWKPRTPDRQVGIAEIAVPGVRASRAIVAPNVKLGGGKDPTAVVLAKTEPVWSGCMFTSLRWVCAPSLVKPTEEQYGFDEGFNAASREITTLTGSVVLTNLRLIGKYAWQKAPHASVTASSTYISDPQDMADSAFDGNPLTAWVSSYPDKRPSLTISWSKPKLISHINIERPPSARQVAQVHITGSDGQLRSGTIGASGLLRFAPLTTSKLMLQFVPTKLPIEVAEVAIPGVDPLSTNPNAPFALKCGLGPLIAVNGVRVPTKVAGTLGDLLTGQPLRYQACSTVAIARGYNGVVESAGDSFDLQSAVFDTPGPHSLAGHPLAVSEPVTTVNWTPGARAIRVSVAKPSYLVVNENYNVGWQARLGNRVLRPVQLDGWRQAWLLPGGSSGMVALTFLPDSLYRIGLLGGLGLLLLMCLAVIFAAVLTRRRARRTLAVGGLRPGDAPVVDSRPTGHGDSAGSAATRPVSSPSRGPLAGRAMGGVVVVASSYALLALVGLWLGGYPGAVILPAATGLFVLLLRGARTSRACAELSRPWIVCALLVAAAAVVAAGVVLQTVSGVPVKLHQSASAQLLCLVIVARLAAALVAAERSQELDPCATAAATTAPQPQDNPHDGLSGPFDQEVAGGVSTNGQQRDGHDFSYRGPAEDGQRQDPDEGLR